MTRKTFWTYTLIVALCGLSASAVIGWKRHQEQPGRRLSSAAWKEKYKSIDELVDGVDAVVLARAVAATPGRIAHSTNGEDALPFEVVEFTVVNGLKGAETGTVVFVERAGGTDNEGHTVHVDIDGGEFEMGNTYLLFLKRQEEGPYYYQVNDEGRYQVAGGRLRAADPDGPVAAFFHGRSVEEGIDIVEKEKDTKP